MTTIGLFSRSIMGRSADWRWAGSETETTSFTLSWWQQPNWEFISGSPRPRSASSHIIHTCQLVTYILIFVRPSSFLSTSPLACGRKKTWPLTLYPPVSVACRKTYLQTHSLTQTLTPSLSLTHTHQLLLVWQDPDRILSLAAHVIWKWNCVLLFRGTMQTVVSFKRPRDSPTK